MTEWETAFPNLKFDGDRVHWQTGFGQAYVDGSKTEIELDGTFSREHLKALVAWMESA
jgi:hypothetical protein